MPKDTGPRSFDSLWSSNQPGKDLRDEAFKNRFFRGSLNKLSPDEVLMVAIDVEVVNGNRLRDFAARFADTSADTATLFSGMASEEDQHRDQLREIYKQRYGDMPQTVGEDDVHEVIEEPELPEDVGVFDSLTLRQALEIVLEAEIKAQGFYREAAKKAEDAGLRALFQELEDFEGNHVHWIEARLEALAERE